MATEEYAEKTGQDCQTCHVDASGGSELTEVGKHFQNKLELDKGETKKVNKILSLLRFIAGYLHIITAVFWFGTILYVHLILRPAYAASGLPKGEVRVGLVSMFIMLVTGTVLTLIRVSSLQMLLETRFGILLLIKIFLFLLMVSAALIAVFFIGPKLRKNVKMAQQQSGEFMTAEELIYFDGKEGKPAYIAYTGNIYDVSKSGIWLEGNHFFKHNAGNDLTDFLGQAPHGEENIKRMPLIGKLVSPTSKKESTKYKKLFYFLAYLNLTFVLLIVLILALWRWWI
jgi:predicted heme/steroid binding protein/uncharacterized membrane protein